MNIKTKFKIGDEVYIVEKDTTYSLFVYKSVIGQILVSEDEVEYYVDNLSDAYTEETMVLSSDKEGLLKLIDDALNTTDDD